MCGGRRIALGDHHAFTVERVFRHEGDSAMRVAVAAFIIGSVLIGVLRHAGHPALIDRGEGQPRDWADRHSAYHVGGAAAVALAVGVVDGATAGGLVSFGLWAAVELAQRFPREGVGYFEWPDVLWNLIGAAAGAALAAAFRGRRRAAMRSS